MSNLPPSFPARFPPAFEERRRQDALVGKLPAFLAKPIHKQIWRGVWKHHRHYPQDVSVEIADSGCWQLQAGEHRFSSIPLEEALATLQAPQILLVATGPSARSFDWAKAASSKPLILGVNGAPTLLSEHALQADALVITDRSFALTGIDHLTRAVASHALLFLEPEAAATLASRSPELLAQAKFTIIERVNRYYSLPARPWSQLAEEAEFFLHRERPEIGFSLNPLAGVFPGGTVAFAALQLALSQQPDQIDLVGLDLGGRGRAYQEAPDQAPASQLEIHLSNRIAPSFSLLPQSLANQPRIRLINHSPSCPLPRSYFQS
ncbi:MAG: hypothetical protein Q7Q71_05530 [Verrucomicrobiota bacterium JB023]|nr:hypothetical protein [Verrucomicrobiota bacterium JB023]